ncbi:radical SAM-linked protein [Tamaricihabitans halophyticus]|uniref:Radical SAM-linked protein n=1 Tax=Tamaricihabitans halophyticus TaxID=1262583 RepID=A0A4R2QH57_9PSEU|nr:TIGR03936 family radical SAM-associated protein [Tamaricihabitans halophyticus]TCP48590.1 radical SAM-linked protein [Tamaricihabitans halophyticus]
MAKLRLRYAKRGKLRFTSHRDIARAVERAVRKAHLPVAFSQGFSPHPKLSWIGAAPTGVASEAEYVEIQLVERRAPDVVRTALNAALPNGLTVLDVVDATGGSLAERIEASEWLLELPGIADDTLQAAAAALLAVPHVEVDRLTKNGMRKLDVRPAVLSLRTVRPEESGLPETPPEATTGVGPYGILAMVVRQTTPTVRPDDVLSALGVVAGLAPLVPVKATRVAQGRLDDAGGLVDPLLEDRGAGAAEVVHTGQPVQHVVD